MTTDHGLGWGHVIDGGITAVVAFFVVWWPIIAEGLRDAMLVMLFCTVAIRLGLAIRQWVRGT